jgi:hypothetical protein
MTSVEETKTTKKATKRKNEEEEELDLGVFTPKSMMAKKQKKKQKSCKQKDQYFYMFKKFAKDVFNEPLTEDEYVRWKPVFRPTKTIREYMSIPVDMTMLTYESLLAKKRKHDQGDVDSITPTGFIAVTDFVNCAAYMAKWQADWLETLGWTCNATGYDINTVSFSSAELMVSGIEWLKMQIKLSCRMLEFEASLSGALSSSSLMRADKTSFSSGSTSMERELDGEEM